ncbi:hypothetical protein [Treponema pectinovorum]|uniref:hypothetical protein n=1 Tax=Treponema pectinovorum TaxID=164 RepID=UPI0011F3E303|nr:hypothetical protein [Treponema pectinovorum]
MNQNKIFLLAFFSLSFFLETASIFCQNSISAPIRTSNLSKEKPSWQAVIGGEAVAQVAETSYGFAVVSDGRLVSTCTSKGNVIFQKGVKGKPSPYFSSWGDFLYAVTEKTKINLINPSGLTVWAKDCGFEVKASLKPGLDGRVFVQGENQISCYGLKGVRKWNIRLEKPTNLPFQFLNDKSLLVFYSNPQNLKTEAVRISPFGSVLEKITFAGQVAACQSFDDGVLLAFSDGSFGLCSVENKTAVSKWVKKRDSNLKIKAIITSSTHSALLYNSGNELKVLIIKNEDGNLYKEFSVGNINLDECTFLKKTEQGFFVSDKQTALEFSLDGIIFWQAKLPNPSTWNYITYTASNTLLLCMKNWVINAFVMSQNLKTKSSTQYQKKQSYDFALDATINYETLSLFNTDKKVFEDIKQKLLQGDYAEEERKFTNQIKEQLFLYIQETNNSSKRRDFIPFYATNPLYTQAVLECVAPSQTENFTQEIATLIKTEKNPLMLTILLKTAGEIGYDSEGLLLKSFEEVSKNIVFKKNTKLLKLLCDSTYDIVFFMGRPALYRQGKQILSNLMYIQYDKEIRDYARQTLSKIIQLEL